MSSRIFSIGALASVLSCGQTETPPDGEVSQVPTAAPGAYESPLAYLLDRYDSNGDGAVSWDEHHRTAQAFARLDRDGNGLVDSADYVAAPAKGSRMRDERAALLIGAYLQQDENGSLLTSEELGRTFEAYDSNGDGLLDEEEFRCGALAPAPGPLLESARARALLKDVDPWTGLLAGVDADADGSLSRSEVLVFHERRGGGAPWVWQEELPSEQALRPLMGLPAPDLTLAPLDGGASVTLSSFEGDRPVALIFGSYT